MIPEWLLRRAPFIAFAARTVRAWFIQELKRESDFVGVPLSCRSTTTGVPILSLEAGEQVRPYPMPEAIADMFRKRLLRESSRR